MLEGYLLQRMARPRGVQQVAREHRVGAESGERDAVAREDHQGEFQIVADLPD